MVETRSQKQQAQAQKPTLVVVRYNLRPRVAKPAAEVVVEAKAHVRVGTLYYNLRPRI
jgi:hypothetical protein